MKKFVIVDGQDRIVREEKAEYAPEWFGATKIPTDGARLKLAPSHPDYSARQGERIIP